MHVLWNLVGGNYIDSTTLHQILITCGEMNTKLILHHAESAPQPRPNPSSVASHPSSPVLFIEARWRPPGRRWQQPGVRPDWTWLRWRTRPEPFESWHRFACTDCGSGAGKTRVHWHLIPGTIHHLIMHTVRAKTIPTTWYYGYSSGSLSTDRSAVAAPPGLRGERTVFTYTSDDFVFAWLFY